MIRYLIKNNFKLMFRNKWSIVVMLLGPVLVIAVLSSAFSELMKSYESVEEFNVGYRVESESMVSGYIESIREAGKEAGITFYEYKEGNPEELMAKHDLAGFVKFTKEEYVLYQSADDEVEGMTLEYFLDRVMSENVNVSLQMMNATRQNDVELPVQELEFMPAINAVDYYGIIYIVYFSWCGIICATGVFSNEKKYGIERKFRVSNVSEMKLYLGKFIPINMTVVGGMGISTIITVLLHGVHWGKPLLSAMIIFGMILAGNAFGMMLYQLSKNLAITIIVQFTIVWILGFLGGSFETYMFSSTPDFLKHLSPIYHGNRALVELSCMGQSEYVGSAIVYSLVITAICSAIAILAGEMRKRGRA
ncbi:MAG: ABC transporter permease [Lachnospiraceae bacterium]|nr:ABC transporter permease [Lachnospiraceae bacterium]